MSTNQAPQFFGSSSEFVNKEELSSSGKAFCILTVTDTSTVYGDKWFLQIFIDGDEELRTMTFAHGDATRSKREQDFIQLAAHPEYLPQHSCYLRKYSFEGKSGYRISARSGGGACPCTTDVPVAPEPLLPAWDEEIPLMPAWDEPVPAAPQPTASPAANANTLENAPASPNQYKTIAKLGAKLDLDVDMPETFGEAVKLIERLEAGYARQVAALNKPQLKVVNSVPMR
jgi:hypothetical protein